MAAEDIKLLRSAVLLQRFSLPELAAHAGTNRNTASSWLKRNRMALEPAGKQSDHSLERGRPRKIWSLLPDGAVNLQKQLAELTFPDDLRRAPNEADPIDRVEQLVKRWRAAKLAADEEMMAIHHGAARIRVRLAWEAYAEMEAARYTVSRRILYTLAELERDLGLTPMWEETALPSVTVWVARRLRAMLARGIATAFSARVLRLRTEVRESAQSVRLTAAAFAAQVWADEDIDPGKDLTPVDFFSCAAVFEDVSIDSRTSELLKAIDPARRVTFGTDAEQRQAILLGMAGFQARHQVPQIAGWLMALPSLTVWSNELAPAVTYGSLEAPYVDARKLFETVGSSLRTILEQPILARGHAGRLRSDAHRFSRDFASRFGVVPEKTESEAAQIDAVTAYFGRGHLANS